MFPNAMAQFARVLKKGGLLVLTGRIKPKSGWGLQHDIVISQVEAQGVRLVAVEDVTAHCGVATEQMLEHVFGVPGKHIPAVSEEEQRKHPEAVEELRHVLSRSQAACE